MLKFALGGFTALVGWLMMTFTIAGYVTYAYSVIDRVATWRSAETYAFLGVIALMLLIAVLDLIGEQQ